MSRIARAAFVAALLIGFPFTHSATAVAQGTSNAGTKGDIDPLLEQVEAAIDITTRRYLSGDVHTPWQIMHGLLALKKDYMIKVDGQKVSAMEWISQNPTYKGDHWFEKTEHGGRAHPYSTAFAFEGHANQFLAIMALAGLPDDHELQVADGGTITVADIINNSKMEINARDEPTWTLWALAHYLGPDARWRNKDGELWSVEQLVRNQSYADLNSAACGGSHGLFALSYARNAYLKKHDRLRGIWLEADQRIQQHIETARAYQNSDGSFSNTYFKGRSHSEEFEKRIASSGHTLEFLMTALSEKQLEQPWVRRGVESVATDLLTNSTTPAECGALYHALHGLIIYRDRIAPPSTADDTHLTRGDEDGTAAP